MSQTTIYIFILHSLKFSFPKRLKSYVSILEFTLPQILLFFNFENRRDERRKNEGCKRERDKQFLFDFELKQNNESLRWKSYQETSGGGERWYIMIFKTPLLCFSNEEM